MMNRSKPATQQQRTFTGPSFGDDVAFLRTHERDLVVLTAHNGQSQVAISPKMQGRVMTSTATGDAGPGYGFINRELIESGKLVPHINPFGGEDRFWIGPEGGQFSVFFAKGAAFDLDHWQTPAPVDTESWDVAEKSNQRALFRKSFQVTNYSGTKFDIQVDREVRLLASN